MNTEAWRRYRILELRYVEGLEISAVQAQLAIGRSEYFREHRRAVDAVVSVMWEQVGRDDRAKVNTGNRGESVGDNSQPLSSDTPCHNLTVQLTSFVGREAEMAEITSLLETTRLLTLTGAGGSGKTRLALEVGANRLTFYPDGVWVVDLAPVADATQVETTAARALGIGQEPNLPMLQSLVNHLRHKHLLLVLDNCEHLIDAAAHLADELLHSCRDMQILATSRERLRMAGEVTWWVPSLPVPTSTARPDELMQYAAVRLFIERSQSAHPGFALTLQNGPAIVQICQRLDGMPLALELAAACSISFSPEQLAARLDQRFRLLTGGSRTALPRHRTLCATIDWSYQLLTGLEQRILHRLAIFAGGWTLEAAETVCAGAGITAVEVLEGLRRVVDTSLVAVERAVDGADRYRMLETIRQYALGKLSMSGEAGMVSARHADYYLALVERLDWLALAWTRVTRPAWLDREHDNLCVALRWCCQRGDAWRALRFGAVLGSAWLRSGHMNEALQWLEEVLALPDRTTPSAPRAWTVFALAHLIARRGDYEGAHALYDESLATFQSLNDPFGEAWTLSQQAMMAFMRGDFQVARTYLSASTSMRDAFTMTDDPNKQAGLRYIQQFTLGCLAVFQDEYAEGWAILEPLLAEQRQAGIRGSSYILGFLGLAALGEGQPALAAEYYREALTNGRENGDVANMAFTVERLAGLAAAVGEAERAACLVGVAAALRREVSAAPGVPQSALLQREVSSARLVLGEAKFESAVAAGEALPIEEGLAEALGG